MLFIASVTLFPQILQTSVATAPSLLVPVTDVVIATMAILLMLRGAPPDRPVLGLVAAGFACNAVSDFSFAVVVSQTGTFTFGSIVDLGWIAGYTLIALAVRTPGSAASPRGERPVESSALLGTSAMFTLFVVAAVLSLVNMNRGTLTAPSAVLWLIVLLGVLARQIMLVIDNERLRKVLEQQVIDRSRSLRQVAQQSDLLVNSVDDGIYGVDQAGLITFVNPAAAARARLCAARTDRRGRPPDVPRRRAATARTTRPSSATSPRRSATGSSPTPRRTATSAPTACRSRWRSPPRH